MVLFAKRIFRLKWQNFININMTNEKQKLIKNIRENFRLKKRKKITRKRNVLKPAYFTFVNFFLLKIGDCNFVAKKL